MCYSLTYRQFPICVVYRYLYMSLALGKPGLMRVRKVSSQISLCSLPRRYFPIVWYLSLKGSLLLAKIELMRKLLFLGSLCGLHWLIWGDALRTCIYKPVFPERGSYIYNQEGLHSKEAKSAFIFFNKHVI